MLTRILLALSFLFFVGSALAQDGTNTRSQLPASRYIPRDSVFELSDPAICSENAADACRPSIEQIAEGDCCDCDPHMSDMQCFTECNADLPRCRPPAPRPPPAPTQTITQFCCTSSGKYHFSRTFVVGAPCKNPRGWIATSVGTGHYAWVELGTACR